MRDLQERGHFCNGSGASSQKCLLWYWGSSSSGIASVFCGNAKGASCYCEGVATYCEHFAGHTALLLSPYSRAFLPTVVFGSFFAYSWSFLTYSLGFLAYSWSFFTYTGKVCLTSTSTDCKQRSPTVRTKTPTVSKRASPFFGALSCCKIPLGEAYPLRVPDCIPRIRSGKGDITNGVFSL